MSVLQAADVSINSPVFVSGSVVVSDISQAEPIEITGSLSTTPVATQSVSLVDTHVTQSVDIAAGDSINIEGTSSVVVTNAIPQDTSEGVSPGGVPLTTFASMSRRELP